MATKFEVVLSAKLDEKSVSDIQKQLDNISKGLKLDIKADTSSVDKMTSSVKDLGNAAGNAKTHTQGLGDIISKFSSWQIVGDVIHGVKNAMEDMVQQVFDLDESLTELDKVTDLTSSGLADLADDVFAVGEQIGATGKDVIDATTLFAQAGYEAKDALDLGEQAIMLKNVSEAGATAEGSASTLIATMKAFNIESTESQHIVDALNQVSNKYAVSVNNLSTAIRKSSASMAAGNNSLEQTFGLVTAGTEILREPGRVANGLSTITARLTQKNDEYIASITGGMGVIDKNTGELRSNFDVLQDLSKAWTHLTSVEKQELTETVAGKTQRSLFTALMTNFESAVGATEAALNSEGSALEENGKRMESLQGKTQQLQSAWQDFARNTIDSGMLKSILSLGTALLKFANTDMAKAIAMTAALLVGSKLLITGLSSLKTVIVTNGQALFQYLLIMQGVPAAEAAASAATLGLAGSIKLLTTALLSNPLFWGALAVTGIVALIGHLSDLKKEAREAAQTLADNSSAQAQEMESLLNKYEELSNKVNKTKEEEKELSSVIDTLNKKYDVSKEKLQGENAEREEAIKKLQKEIAEKKKLAATSAESAIDFKRGDREVLTSRDNVSIKSNLAKQYDLEGKTIAEVEKKMVGYIETLQNKNNKTKEEEKDLNKLMSLYGTLSGDLEKYREGYKQAAENLQNGIPITTEQANALYQLGEITQDNAISIEAYNNWLSKNKDATEEQKDLVWEGIEAQIKKNETDADGAVVLDEYAQKIKDTKDALEDANKDLDEFQKSFSTLTSVVDEYNSNGYLSIDTLQQLLALDDQYLSMLSMENGQLVLNTQEMDNYTNALIAQKVESLQAAAIQDLYNLSIGNVDKLSETAKTAISNLGTDVNNTKTDMENAIPTMDKFNQKLRESAELYGVATGDKKGEADAIIDSYKDLFSKVTGLGASTSKAGGTSGKGHRYTGKSSGGKKSSGSKSSKSAKEEYKAEVDALYWYKNALDTAKDSVDKLNDTLKNTDNFNEQEKYIRQLIDATNNQINKTNDLKNAQANQINDYINQLRAQGFAINYNASSNELYINNMERLGQLSGDNAKAMEKLIDKIQNLNDNNRNLDGSIRDLTADVKDYYQQLADFPEKKLEKFNDLMKEFQQSQLDVIQYQIDDIQHEMDNDPRLKALEEQIEALEKQNDELDNQKELEEKLLAVEEAKIKLQNAQRQKTLQVYREGQGFVWETDPDSIKEAAEELKDAQDDLNDKIKQDQIDQLKAEKEALEKSYQDRIDALEKFLDEQNYLIDKANREGAQTFDELRKELAKFGLDSAEYLGKATDWLNNYNKSLAELNETVGGILSSSSQATDGMIYSSAVQDRIDQALSSLIPSITPSTGVTLSNIDFDKIKGTDKGQSIYINNIELPNVQDIDDFVAALRDLPNMATSQSSQRN